MDQISGQGKLMKNSQNAPIISSILKTVASENLVTEAELNNCDDKPLENLLHEKTEENGQTENNENEKTL